jgi:hypothetical protein
MLLSLTLAATADCNDVTLEIYVDSNKIFQSAASTQVQTVSYSLSENPSDHVLRLVMSGKTRHHTTINPQGEILHDVAFLLNALEFENIDMTPVFYHNNPCYTHNLNGSAIERVDEFSGYIGCNGTIDFKFSTPIHLWMYQKI